jgi:hypothetical protein
MMSDGQVENRSPIDDCRTWAFNHMHGAHAWISISFSVAGHGPVASSTPPLKKQEHRSESHLLLPFFFVFCELHTSFLLCVCMASIYRCSCPVSFLSLFSSVSCAYVFTILHSNGHSPDVWIYLTTPWLGGLIHPSSSWLVCLTYDTGVRNLCW